MLCSLEVVDAGKFATNPQVYQSDEITVTVSPVDASQDVVSSPLWASRWLH
jgi:hypothetical protein